MLLNTVRERWLVADAIRPGTCILPRGCSVCSSGCSPVSQGKQRVLLTTETGLANVLWSKLTDLICSPAPENFVFLSTQILYFSDRHLDNLSFIWYYLGIVGVSRLCIPNIRLWLSMKFILFFYNSPLTACKIQPFLTTLSRLDGALRNLV